MLTQNTIDRLKDLSLVDVVARYSLDKWKKNGANYSACCPFHAEKTPSFSVSETKNIYKCFGCGAGGNGAISFVMQIENKSFYEACLHLCSMMNIEPEHEPRELTEKQKEKLSEAQLQEKVLNIVVPIYQKALKELPETHPAKEWLNSRGFTDDMLAAMQIGWCNETWHHTCHDLINQNLYQPALELGVIKTKEGTSTHYDGYRSRIIFPIKNRNNRLVGLGGRYIKVNPNDAEKINKYLNPNDCALYSKSNILYGYEIACKEITKHQKATIVEGYTDVTSAHRIGITTAVGTCGTALTAEHIKILKRDVKTVCIWHDNDPAGIKSFQKNLVEFLKLGFLVTVLEYEGKDPDEFANNHFTGELPKEHDAVIYRAKQIWLESSDQPAQRAMAKVAILELLSCITNEIIKNNYLDTLVAEFKWNSNNTKKEFASIEKVNPTEPEEEIGESIKWAAWMNEEDKDQVMNNGYLAVNRKVNGKPMVGYFSFNQNGKVEITNFLVKPLFHVYAGVESRYLVQIDNGYRSAVLDVPAKNIPSIDLFQGYAVSEGNYLIFGSKPQWLRIASQLLQTFPRCVEIKFLGWQSPGFFAWVDKIYIPEKGLVDLDNWGIIKHDNESYLVPASCEAYKQLQRTGDDPYEADRYLSYRKADITVTDWANMLMIVYREKGPVAIAYTVLTLFRDVVFEIDNNCPHLYAFGEPSSGKSKWAETITAIFYSNRPAYNLNSGTDTAFFRYMAAFQNCPAHLNEFEIEVIKPEWFQAIKGVFDGESRQRGKMGSRNAVEIMKVKSTLVLTGQKLITADDNSVVTRSIIEAFSVRDDIQEHEKQAYDRLKDYERKGMNSLLQEFLIHRKWFAANYKETFNNTLSNWRKNRPESRTLNQRIMQNHAHMYTCYALMYDKISLPVSKADFEDYCFGKAVYWSKFIRNSDTLSEFWRTLDFLADQQQIHYGWDYVLKEETTVTIRKDRNTDEKVNLPEPTKILYLRLNNVHKLFQTAYRSRTGKEAMNLENLLHYFSSRKYFIGAVKAVRFQRVVKENSPISGPNGSQNIVTNKKIESTVSSCYAFVYDDLGLNIHREDAVEEGGYKPAMDAPL